MCGIEYCGGIAIGAGDMMGRVIHYGSNPSKFIYDGLLTLGEKISVSEKVSDVYTSANKFPRFLYFLTANSIMRCGMKTKSA